MSTFFGMRSNADWVADQRPKNWRETILYLYPNGMAPLTAILSLMKSRKVDDPEFNWWTKTFPALGGSINGVYTDAGLTTAYSGGGVAGDTLYIGVLQDVADQFVPNDQCLIYDSSDIRNSVNAKVTAVTKNGDNSYLTVQLLEDDDNGGALDLSSADYVKRNGTINAEGGLTPDALAYNPTKLYNYTQIFRNSIEMTRTAMRTRLRTGDQVKQAKQEALEVHGALMDAAFLTGVPTENTGSNGKPERTAGGIIHFLRTYAPTNIRDYPSLNSGTPWLSGGDDFLAESMELLTRFSSGGSDEYLVLCGSGALLGIERLARNSGMFTITKTEKIGYGVSVRYLRSSFGDFALKTHPLMSQDPGFRNAMLFLKPKNLTYAYVDDTQFYGSPEGKDFAYDSSGKRIDGINNEFLTEASIEVHFVPEFMLLTNINVDG